jgi:hypothetical protein
VRRSPPPCRNHWRILMQLRVGFEMIYDCPQPTPMIFNLNVHLHASIRPGRPRQPGIRPAGSRDRVSRQLRQLVYPHRRPQRSHARLS